MHMKLGKFNRSWFFILGVVAMAASSCQKVLDINRDPNQASTATVDLILPAAQMELSTAIGNTPAYVSCMWAQYWTGGYGVSTTALEYYNMANVDVESHWTRSYARTLADIQFLTKSGQPIYSGMGKIMAAYLYQMLADLHGDVPFSEALKGAIEDGSVLTPKFDDPEEIYAALQTQLDEAITEINTTGDLVQEPGADDLIYEGDIAKWEAFANTIKLKLYVRSGNVTAAKALMDAGTTFIGAGDDAKISFFETTKNTNPIYARFVSRIAVGMYYSAAAASVDYLDSTGDPRINGIYKPGNTGHVGVMSGDVNDNTVLYPPPSGTAEAERAKYSSPNPDYVFSATTPVFLISEWESYFLQAETLIRSGEDATALFEAGVQANFDYYDMSADAPAYIATLGFSSADPIDDQLDILAVQKWIASNGLQMAEGWLETLRFDRPGHHMFTDGIYTSPINNVLGDFIFPTSFIYPTQEVSLNPNTPARTVSDKRFWDN